MSQPIQGNKATKAPSNATRGFVRTRSSYALKKQNTVVGAIMGMDSMDDGDDAPAMAMISQGPKDPKTKAIITAAIKGNFLFRHLDEYGVDAVIASMLPHPVKKGEAIIKQGDKGDFFYVCQSGQYDVLVDRKVVHTYEVHEKERKFPAFGELALMYAKPRAAGVVAKTDGQLWKMDRNAFRRLQSSARRDVDLTKVMRQESHVPFCATIWLMTLSLQPSHPNALRPCRQVLRKVDIFSSLNYAQLQQLRDEMRTVNFLDGQFVFKQGDDPKEGNQGEAFYVIIRGEAIIIKEDGNTSTEVCDPTELHPSILN